MTVRPTPSGVIATRFSPVFTSVGTPTRILAGTFDPLDMLVLAALFAEDGVYRNTPFVEQRGRAAIMAYWQRTKLQSDIRLTYEVLQREEGGGIAHWHTTYQVTSEELFRIWAASTGTNLR